MTSEKVRMIVGLLVILTHIVSYAGVILFKSEHIPPNDRFDVALVLIPVSAAYVVAIVRSAINRQGEIGTTTVVNWNYALVTFLITAAFCLALLVIVFGYPSVGASDIATLKRYMLLVEVAFGGAFGLIAEDLFGKIEKIEVPAPTAREGE